MICEDRQTCHIHTHTHSPTQPHPTPSAHTAPRATSRVVTHAATLDRHLSLTVVCVGTAWLTEKRRERTGTELLVLPCPECRLQSSAHSHGAHGDTRAHAATPAPRTPVTALRAPAGRALPAGSAWELERACTVFDL
jgi:hypothetical protein